MSSTKHLYSRIKKLIVIAGILLLRSTLAQTNRIQERSDLVPSRQTQVHELDLDSLDIHRGGSALRIYTLA